MRGYIESKRSYTQQKKRQSKVWCMYCMLPMNRILFLNLLETFTFRNKKMPRIEGKNIFYSILTDCQYGTFPYTNIGVLYYNCGMNIYFTASIVGKKHHSAHYEHIIQIAKAHGATVQSDHIMKSTEGTIRMETKGERLMFHKKLESWIDSCDCMIAETTFPSISVGYEISLALHRGKPILILYNEGDPPSLLFTQHEEKLICEKYTAETLTGTIEDFLAYVQGNADMRFTFFISSAIASYLNKVSKKQKVPKSVYIRRLIEQDMKNQ
jgi:2'-deoxynucleoside 5'-phosphate N-hydrolase